MSFRSKFLLVVFSASLALYAVVGGWMSINAQQQQNDPGAQLRIFESVLRHIQDDYVDEPDLNKVRAGALRGSAAGRTARRRPCAVSRALVCGTVRAEPSPSSWRLPSRRYMKVQRFPPLELMKR